VVFRSAPATSSKQSTPESWSPHRRESVVRQEKKSQHRRESVVRLKEKMESNAIYR
jgi:hypothetical protein